MGEEYVHEHDTELVMDMRISHGHENYKGRDPQSRVSCCLGTSEEASEGARGGGGGGGPVTGVTHLICAQRLRRQGDPCPPHRAACACTLGTTGCPAGLPPAAALLPVIITSTRLIVKW
jgi:hypothetical protein